MSASSASHRTERPLRQARSQETRRRLLKATLDSVFELGCAGTTTAGVAERADVTQGAHLYHFRTRERMMLEALDASFEASLATGSEVVGRRMAEGALPSEALMDAFEAPLVQRNAAVLAEFMLAARTDPALAKAVALHAARARDAFVPWLESRSGRTLEPERTEVVFELLVALQRGLSTPSGVTPRDAVWALARDLIAPRLSELIDP